MKLSQNERVNSLLDFYGALLTPKQADYMRCYYREDYSLGEISTNFKVSRQAVYDNLRRTELVLERYEQKLGLYQKFEAQNQKIDQIQKYVDHRYKNDDRLKKLIQELESLENK